MFDLNDHKVLLIVIGVVALALIIYEFRVICSEDDKFKSEINFLSREIERHDKEHEQKVSELNNEQQKLVETHSLEVKNLNKAISDLTAKNYSLNKQVRKYKSLYEEYESYLIEQLNFKNIHDILPLIPESTSFVLKSDKYLPIDKNKPGKYGSYTVFKSRNGNVYHFIQGCSGAYNEFNYINIKDYNFIVCKKCSSYISSEMELCDLWSEDFEYLINLIKDKDITIDFSEKEVSNNE